METIADYPSVLTLLRKEEVCDRKTANNGPEGLLDKNGLEEGNRSTDDVIFVGAAQSQVSHLQKLATDTLDLAWPNWRNYENPECCILPPIFSYTNPTKTDLDCGDEKEKLRRSERAEHIVYKSIWRSAQKKPVAPIMVVHSLNLDRIRHHLPHMFPNVRISQSDPFLREYDFVLIGPKIGLVVIEVKSSEFSAPSDFKSNTHLPKDYSDGIKQLQYFAVNFLNFLQECIGISWPEESPVRRILFLPNLERARHEKWSQKLEPPTAGSFDHSDAHTIKWYKEDLDNGEENGKDPELLTTISKLLNGEHDQEISREVYEAYASTISGMASVLVFKNQSNTRINPLKLFQREILVTENDRIGAQDPGGQLKKGKLKAETLQHFSKVIMPTRGQLVALKGPNRQFIFGPAGTGVLQEKALQLLKNGLKVLILAPKSCCKRYKELFDSNSLHEYGIRSLETVRQVRHRRWKHRAFDKLMKSYNDGTDPIEAIYKYLQRRKGEGSFAWRYLENYFQWMDDFDAVLIDDAIDRLRDLYGLNLNLNRSSLVTELTTMAYSELKYPDKTLWIALDPMMPDYEPEHSHHLFRWVLGHLFTSKRDYGQKWSVSVLDKVMRSSENIFRVVYQDNGEAIPEFCVRPSIGHKIVGPEVTYFCDYYDGNAAETLWARINLELKRLSDQEIPLSWIAIVVGGAVEIKNIRIMRFLIDKLHRCGIPLMTQNMCRNADVGGTCDIWGALSINYWDDVSTLEWPIVIYAAAYQEWSDRTNHQYRHQGYRGRSRATTKLIDIEIFPFTQK